MRVLDLTLITSLLYLLICTSVFTTTAASSTTDQENVARDFFAKHAGSDGSAHTNNWAVLVCASRYWFNYRHMANALGMYRTVKRLGIPDSNIILMLADDVACNSRNKFAGSVYADSGRHLDLYGENIEVDYRGYEVTVENFIRVLTGRVPASAPRSKRLLTDDRSNVFVYMTGHGGNEFLKFQDNEEISAFDIADAFEQMWQKKRYNEIFFVMDTCQANTMYSKFYSPNILATGSAELGENSYSYENDQDIGVAVIDSFTHYVLQFMEGINKTSQRTVQDLFNSYQPAKLNSHPGVRSDLFHRPLDRTLITDFFGGVAQAELVTMDDERDLVQENTAVSDGAPSAVAGLNDPRQLSHPRISKTNTDPHRFSKAPTSMPSWSWIEFGKGMRAWIPVVVLGGLVGWVSLSRWQLTDIQ